METLTSETKASRAAETAESPSAVSGERATAQRHPFCVVANEHGGFDIVARLDTGYADRSAADAALRRLLDALAAAP